MHRDNWAGVYANQDSILKVLSDLDEDIFLAGGTGLHRFVLSKEYRHSEDLDFFFPRLYSKAESQSVMDKIITKINRLSNVKLEDKRWLKEEKVWRAWYSFEENDEIVKLELLNFTCERLYDKEFICKDVPFKIENLYNLLLYKLKALCDRPDTIKDLFDLYFILRDVGEISIDKMMIDLNKKFEPAIHIHYDKKDIIRALKYDLKWDIEIGDIAHIYDLQQEIKDFQHLLKDALQNEDLLDFGYKSRIMNRAKFFEMDVENYLELMDILEENNFWINEVKSIGNI